MKPGPLAAVAASSLLLAAPASARGVKIGILNDQSGVYADYGGKYSVEAAKMAIEDFGGEVIGQKIELVTADHQNKPEDAEHDPSGTYSATLSYLKAVKAAGSKDSEAVAKKLKELPVDDAFAKGKVLANGRMAHDMYLLMPRTATTAC